MSFRRRLFFDTETYSELDLKKVGSSRYAESAEIIMVQYAIDDEDPVAFTVGWQFGGLWPEHSTPGAKQKVLELLSDPDTQVVIHNSSFDLAVLRHAWGVRIPRERVYDTMVQALSNGLPGGLERVSRILKLPPGLAKEAELGKAGMHLFCKPRPANHRLRRATPRTHPKEWSDFLRYGLSDIHAMRAVYQQLPDWNYRKDGTGTGARAGARLFRLDGEINDRGICVDQALVESMLEALAWEKLEQKRRTKDLTSGSVESIQQRDLLLAHLLAEHGVSLPDLKKDTLLRRLDDESLPAVARELIELRLESNKTSTAKYRRLVESISTDGRLRNTLQMYGAARTGRFAGRVFQPHNLPRPTLKSGMIEEGIEAAIGGMLPLWLSDQPGLEAFAFASNAIRGVVTAPPGKKLVVSDWANIEGRVAAAIAGEEWKILAFLEFDALVGPDLYLLSYARSFGLDVADVPEDGPERQMGKVQELSLQYEGGGNAFASMAAVYRMDLRAMADAVREVADPEVWKNAEGFVGWMKQHKKPLPSEDMEVCAACEVVKSGWRENHPAIVGLWRELSHAWRLAAHNPGKEFTAGPNGLLKFYHRAGWLRIVLPSGRSLVYMHPRADEDGGLRFTGLNPYTQKWGTVHTFGGKLFENIVQAVSADVLIEALHRVDPVMPVVLHVHDEIITEVYDTPEHTPEKLSAIMCEKVPWLPELPLAAKGFETYRYRKG